MDLLILLLLFVYFFKKIMSSTELVHFGDYELINYNKIKRNTSMCKVNV